MMGRSTLVIGFDGFRLRSSFTGRDARMFFQLHPQIIKDALERVAKTGHQHHVEGAMLHPRTRRVARSKLTGGRLKHGGSHTSRAALKFDAAPHDTGAVQYIFERNQQALRVEITGNQRDGYCIAVREPDGSEQCEEFVSSASAHARWAELQDAYKSGGWSGPAILD